MQRNDNAYQHYIVESFEYMNTFGMVIGYIEKREECIFSSFSLWYST